jgi:hypothetical protein
MNGEVSRTFAAQVTRAMCPVAPACRTCQATGSRIAEALESAMRRVGLSEWEQGDLATRFLADLRERVTGLSEHHIARAATQPPQGGTTP